jgi:hypothetical protein
MKKEVLDDERARIGQTPEMPFTDDIALPVLSAENKAFVYCMDNV